MMVSPFLNFTQASRSGPPTAAIIKAKGAGSPVHPAARPAVTRRPAPIERLLTRALPAGFEPATVGLEGRRSIQTELREPDGSAYEPAGTSGWRHRPVVCTWAVRRSPAGDVGAGRGR